MKRILAAALCISIVVSTVSCSFNKGSLNRYQATFLELFDTVSTITGYERDKETFAQTTQYMYDQLKEYHQLYDIYNDYEGINNIKTINDNAGIAPVKVDSRIIDMLDLAYEMYDITGGMVNVAMGSVLKLWHDAREYGINNPEKAYVPDSKALSAAAGHMDMSNVVIDHEGSTVYLKDPEMSLDVGAIGKGYAVEAVCSAMEESGLDHYVVSVGGNIRAIGSKGDGARWNIGIEDPNGGDDYLMNLGIVDKTVVTSGSYQRYYTVNGISYHHIINPRSLYPDNMYVSVTVLSNSSAVADALSTALFNMEFNQGLLMVEKMEAAEAMWVYSDGSCRFSNGFEGYRIDGGK